MRFKPNIGRLCLPREQHLVDNCPSKHICIIQRRPNVLDAGVVV